jgi:hypothetical protein
MDNIEKEIERYKQYYNITDDSDNYDYECLKSAYKAYQSLAEDEHSGNSIKVAQMYLNRLIDEKPLTSIIDTDFDDAEDLEYGIRDDVVSYKQCPRMYSLFRTEYKDGKVEYSDIDRTVAIDINDQRFVYYRAFCNRIVDTLYPIEMPYYPRNGKFKVYYEGCIIKDENNMETEYVKISKIITPDGDNISLIDECYEEYNDCFIKCSNETFEKAKQISLEQTKNKE